MIAVYVLFLYNIGAAVYIMKLGYSSKLKEATAINKKALKFLPILIIILVVMVVVSKLRRSNWATEQKDKRVK